MSLSRKIINSSLWMVSWQWLNRLLGFISLIILARILTPDDYGLVFKATIIIAFLEIITVLGVDKYVLNHPESNDNYNTAWTLKLIQFLLVSLVIYLVSYSASLFMNEPRLELMLEIMTIGIILNAFQNIGIAQLTRKMAFRKIFYFGLLRKICGFVVTIAVAIIFRSYWALVAGFLTTRLAGLILSYVVSDYRPKLCLSRWRDQWLFTKWVLLDNIAVYIRNKSDQLVVAYYFDSEQVGYYGMGVSISEMPTTELMTPIYEVLYPALAQSKDDKGFEKVVLNLYGAVTSVMLPIVAGVMLVADALVYFLLGPQWQAVATFIILLAPLGLFWSYTGLLTVIMQVKGKVACVAKINWIYSLVVIPSLVAAAYYGDAEAVATAKLLVCIGLIGLYVWPVMKLLNIKVAALMSELIRPIASVAVMYSVLDLSYGGMDNHALHLFLSITTGAIIYSAVLYTLWIISGKPLSGEHLLASKIKERFTNRDGA